jgi:hypothetical protein
MQQLERITQQPGRTCSPEKASAAQVDEQMTFVWDKGQQC